MTAPSYVYIFAARHGGLKVGYSNDPARRLVSINRHRDIGAEIKHRVETANPQRCEFLAHLALQAFRLDGEWFSCPLSVAIEAVDQAAAAAAIPDTRTPARVFKSGRSR